MWESVAGIIVCPHCTEGSLLKEGDTSIRCLHCQAEFEMEDGIVNYYKVGIDSVEFRNYLGYNRVAGEFSDAKRRTTANFHQLTKRPLHNMIIESLKNKPILDLGCGIGFVTNMLVDYFPSESIIATDLCMPMLRQVKASHPYVNLLCCSAFSLPLRNNSVGNVISSLCDPFCNERMFEEVNRVLVPGGLFGFTIPSSNWILDSRKDKDISKFILDDGSIIEVNSFLYDEGEMVKMAQNKNFNIETAEKKFGYDLMYINPGVISPSIHELSENLGRKWHELPLVDFYIFKKL